MQNYFFELDSDGRARLETAGIPFAPVDLGFGNGVIVDQANLKKTLITLEGEVKDEMATTFEGLKKLILRFRGEGGEAVEQYVTVANWNGNGRDRFVEIAREFAKKIAQKVVIHVPHGCNSVPITNDDFHIFVWSAPSGSQNEKKTPARLFGIEVACRDSNFSPSGIGEVICDEAGYPVGEIVGENNLYIFHDLVHNGASSEFGLFKRILDETFERLKTVSPEEREERKRKLAEDQRARSREQYIKSCAGRINRETKQIKSVIEEAQSQVEEYQSQLVERLRRVRENERRLEFLITCGKDDVAEFALEYDKLLEVPKVSDVQVLDGKVIVFTDILTCTDPRDNKVYELGKFRIELQTNGGEGIVRMFNLTRQVKGFEGRDMHAPHVFPTGKPCLGNMEEVLPELVAQFQFAAAAMVAINYLEAVNPDDRAGKHVVNWPRVK